MYPDRHFDKILAIRHFNRFYTKQIGLLQKRMLGSPYTLVEARILYEIAAREDCTASEICDWLELDAGYLSRILKKFEENKLVERCQCGDDGRRFTLALTEFGRMEQAKLAEISNEDVGKKIAPLGDHQIEQLVTAMKTIEDALANDNDPHKTAIIRSHRPGDIGWVASSQAEFYANEYGFNENFEALVLRICADFISDYDSAREHCWIAEVNGKNVGSIMLVEEAEDTAKLRLFYVDAEARGLGLGTRLVDECLSFAKNAGYKRVVLYTNACLTAARRIYERAGFHLINEAEHATFGDPQVEQDWLLEF